MEGQSKTIDSLKKGLLNVSDTQQVNILNEISELYFQLPGYVNANYISVEQYATKALQLSKQINYAKGAGIALFNAGNVLSQSSYKGEDLHGAIIIFNQAIPFLKESGENKILGYCFELLADDTHDLGYNKQAINYYDSSLIALRKIKDTAGIILSLEWKGHSYFDLGDYKNAYSYGQQALALAQITNDTVAQVHAASHLANLFLGAGMPESVLEYMRIITLFYPSIYKTKEFASWEIWWGLLKEGDAYLQLGDVDSAMIIAQTTGFNPDDVDTDMFLGRLFNAKHQYTKALFYFKDGFQRSEHTTHTISLARHANGVSQVYLAIGKYDSALYYGNKALMAAQSIHALLEMKNAISTLTDIYDKTHNYTKAYHFSQLYKTVSDSLAPEQYKRKLALIEIQDELDNQKQQAQLLAKENQLQAQQNILEKERAARMQTRAIIIITALLIIGVVIVINIRLKRKKDELQKKQLQQELELQTAESKRHDADFKIRSFELEAQALRAQMNPHFIFNCLNSINRFIINNDAAKAADYLTKFAKLIRIVLEQSGKPLIALEDELFCLRLYMDLEALRFENPFQYKIDLNGTDSASVMMPTMLLQPFVENAVWHGLHPKQNGIGEIDIKMHQHNNILHCSICDNGVGTGNLNNTIQHDKKSLGISITQQRLQLANTNNEEIKIEIHALKNEAGGNAGTCVNIKIPVIYT